MIIKTITVENFRQLKETSLTFDKGITILAGPNNSGKTTLVNLLKNIFNKDKARYSKEDIPATKAKEWVDEVFPIFQNELTSNGEEEGKIEKILNIIYPSDENISKKLIETCTIKIQVDYNPEKRIVAHVHDEVIIEANPQISVTEVCKQMSQVPPWAKGLLLDADGYECEFYQKD